MSYLRLKWIKGHPYLYEQASYRVGKQVKTRHIRYIGKHGYRGATSVGSAAGFQPPGGLTPERRAYIDRYIARLKHGPSQPYEREILRQVLYHHNFAVSILTSQTARGQVWHTQAGEVTKFRLRKDAHAFTWLHELSHLLEFGDHLVDDELMTLRAAFRQAIQRAYREAATGDVEQKATFIQQFGPLINLRQALDTWLPDAKPVENQFIYQQLERVRAGELPEAAFTDLLRAWVDVAYRLSEAELFADSVASLMLNPQFAFRVHGQAGKPYLAKLYLKLYQHLERKYHLSLGRPAPTPLVAQAAGPKNR